MDDNYVLASSAVSPLSLVWLMDDNYVLVSSAVSPCLSSLINGW